jgi:hypothetical protein
MGITKGRLYGVDWCFGVNEKCMQRHAFGRKIYQLELVAKIVR